MTVATPNGRRTAFGTRARAGHLLSQGLLQYAYQPGVVVLALPRGGVPVAHEVARALSVPLDVLVVRKLAHPDHPELALGAIGKPGIRMLNRTVIQHHALSSALVEAITARERLELDRHEGLYRFGRPPLRVAGLTVILVDDGVATGEPVRAAIAVLRHSRPHRIIVAVPVLAQTVEKEIRRAADELVTLVTAENLGSLSRWYADDLPTADEDVCRLLAVPAHAGFDPGSPAAVERIGHSPLSPATARLGPRPS
jgi:putative phosphoribosyl transferase